MKTRADYDTAIEVIGSVINAWDPYHLIADGAPRNEFDAEVAQLVTRIPHIHSADDAAREIFAVFSAAFGPEDFTAPACAEVGAQLFDGLQKTDLLVTRKV